MFAVNRVRPRRRDFSLQLAHRENQCSPDLCAENDARRDRCVFFVFFKAGHAGRATAGKSRRLNDAVTSSARGRGRGTGEAQVVLDPGAALHGSAGVFQTSHQLENSCV